MRHAEWAYTAELNAHLPAESPLGNNLRDCRVSFDGFAASVEFSGVLPPRTRYESQQPDVGVGQVVKPWPEIEAHFHGRKVVFEQLDEHGATTRGSGEVSVPARAARVRIEWAPELAPHRVILWCLNAPGHSELGWMRMSHREVHKRSTRSLGPWTDERSGIVAGSARSDHLLLPAFTGTENPSILALVPEQYCQATFRPLGIHLSLPRNATPAPVVGFDRELEMLSFVLGRRLIPLGWTVLDKNLDLVRTVWRDAWSLNLAAECAVPTLPPIPMNGGTPSHVPEAKLGALLGLLLAAPEEYELNDIFWRIWIARGSALETRLPILAGAMEALMRSWFQSRNSKSKGSYYTNEAWRAATARARSVLEGELGGRQYAERVLRRFDGLNNFGVNERFPFFFDEIGLKVGEVELRAIQARNVMAHGGASNGKLQFLLDQEQAYGTLLNRAVLKIAGWEGEYVDYSNRTRPSRALAEPLGGPNGDGVATAGG